MIGTSAIRLSWGRSSTASRPPLSALAAAGANPYAYPSGASHSSLYTIFLPVYSAALIMSPTARLWGAHNLYAPKHVKHYQLSTLVLLPMRTARSSFSGLFSLVWCEALGRTANLKQLETQCR